MNPSLSDNHGLRHHARNKIVACMSEVNSVPTPVPRSATPAPRRQNPLLLPWQFYHNLPESQPKHITTVFDGLLPSCSRPQQCCDLGSSHERSNSVSSLVVSQKFAGAVGLISRGLSQEALAHASAEFYTPFRKSEPSPSSRISRILATNSLASVRAT